jgi:alkanesulfonate monooxygenase SsuD/methylene tetrahydromethanopterin reductase-like flavin-dependent oxidoreductase (luciferase family)
VALLKVGVRIPSVMAPDMGDLKRFVQQVEAAGFDSIWAGDHVFHHTDVLAPIDLLSYVAAVTDRVGLGTAVINAGYLHPVLLAKQAATLAYLSGGRFQLGISIGGSPAEYASLGISMKQRVGRVLEGIELMRRLWREEDVAHDGRYFHVEHGNLRPKLHGGSVPVLLAAQEDAMLDRIAAIADGWFSGSHYTFDDYVRGAARIRTRASELGRGIETMSFNKVQDVSVHASHDEARRRAADHWQRYYGPSHAIDHASTYGTPDECIAQLRRYAAIDVPSITLILEPTSMSLEELALLTEVKDGVAF